MVQVHTAASEARSKQEELHVTALQQTPAAIAITSLAGYLLYANESFLELCELGQEAIATRSDIREASSQRINSSMLEPVAREGREQQFLVAWPVANDASREFLCSISRAQENSTPACLTFVLQNCSVAAAEYRRKLARDLGMQVDVTARDHRHLQHDRAWVLQELLEAADTPIYMVDRKLRFICFNSTYSRMVAAMGAPPVTIGESVLDTLADPARRRHLGSVLGRVFNGTRVIEAVQTSDEVAGALQHWFDFSFTPARRQDGRIDAVVASGRDVSAVKLADHRREQFNEEVLCRVEQRTSELHATTQELNALVLGVSHDLQSPLRSLDALLARAGEQARNPQSAAPDAYFQKARAATSRMRLLVEALLKLSRVGMRAQQLETVDPNRLVREVLQDLTALTAGREIEMQIEHLPAIESDPVLLRQILQDLLNNAITFTRHRKPARIQIRTVRSDAGMVWSVIDNGVGFEMQDATRIFVPFVQLHRQFRRHGNGIGLVIVKRALRELGGRVWAESAPDRGASFHFILGAKTAVRHDGPG